jgi:hypothetical protein
LSTSARQSIVERILAIAAWRRERGQQDLHLGPQVVARSTRSANGLEELAAYFQTLDPDDARLQRLVKLASHGDSFDPGASLLTELGRFRFHDPTTPVDAFVEQMIELAEIDASEERSLGGPQVAGDNPWRANFEIRIDDE